MSQKELSRMLIIICCAIFAGIIAVCALGVPSLADIIAAENPSLDYLKIPCLFYIWIAALGMLVSLIIAINICRRIGADNSFCVENSNRLKTIGKIYFALAIYFFAGALILMIMKLLFLTVIVVFTVAVIVTLAISVISFVLSHLTYKAYMLKCDSELTI